MNLELKEGHAVPEASLERVITNTKQYSRQTSQISINATM